MKIAAITDDGMTISLSIVYWALSVFEELGLARALHLEGEHHPTRSHETTSTITWSVWDVAG